jgi:hypothetical protein
MPATDMANNGLKGITGIRRYRLRIGLIKSKTKKIAPATSKTSSVRDSQAMATVRLKRLPIKNRKDNPGLIDRGGKVKVNNLRVRIEAVDDTKNYTRDLK